MIKRKLIIFLLLVLFNQIKLTGFDYEYNLILKDKIIKPCLRNSVLNPENILLLEENLKNTFEPTLELKLYFSDYFSFQLNDAFSIESEESKTTKLTNNIRELYLTVTPIDFLFIDVGRKVIRKGVSFFKNPVDFVKNKGNIEMSKSKSEQTKLLTGSELINTEIFLKGITINIIYSPKLEVTEQSVEQFETILSSQFNTLNFDFFIYYSEIYKYGLNFSIILTDYLEFHFEASLIEKQDKWFFTKQYNPFLSETVETIKYPVNLISGFHFSFENGTELYCEYYYNQTGYSKEQWNRIINELESQNNINTLFINSLIDKKGYTELQKHYAMMRIEKNEIIKKINGSFTTVFEFYYTGAILIPSITYNIIEDLDITFFSTVFTGTSKSEFSIIPFNSIYTLELKYYF